MTFRMTMEDEIIFRLDRNNKSGLKLLQKHVLIVSAL